MRKCSIKGCDKDLKAKGMCSLHYNRNLKYGSPFIKTLKPPKIKLTSLLEYNLYRGIKNRCFNKRTPDYNKYGGRGITLHKEWLDDFMLFYEYIKQELGERPSNNHTLDRIDNDGNYEPGNIRWADKITQARNRRVRKDSKSGVSGVTWCKRDSCWVVRISIDKKEISLGQYKDLDDAKRVRLEAEKKLKFNDNKG